MALYLLGGALMAHVGAFHTGEASPWLRYPYFLVLNGLGGLIALGVSRALDHRPWFASRTVLRAAVQPAGVTLLLTPVVWLMAAWWLNGDRDPLRMLVLAQQVGPVALAFAPVLWWTKRRPPPPDAPAPPVGETADFRQRLPRGLRSADIHAVEAQDHYLMVYTSGGSALVTLRLADALAELDGLDGARTHRSWWVARAAVIDARRGRGRAVLQLPDGVRAPVSRTYAPALRAAGWF